MKPKVINPLKAILVLGTMVFLGCQSPVTSVYHGPSSNASLGKGLTVSWSSPTTSARTIMPSSFPTPSTYNISLTPTSGSPVNQTGVTSTSWTFSNLTPSVYAVTVAGLDGSGNTIVQGTSSVDTTSNATASVAVTLNYALTGTGTGQINLTLNLASAGVGSTTATVRLVDPAGNISSPTLVGSGSPGSNYTYSNATAAVGSWQAFFMVKTGTQTAMKMESILVFQNVSTTATLTFASSDFNATYVPVTAVSLSQSSLALGATNSGTLSVTFSPSNASNQLVAWSSSNLGVATVNQSGVVSVISSGTVNITATSVDNQNASATCAITVSFTITFDPNGASQGSVPSPISNCSTGQVLPVPGNTGQLAKPNYVFSGWSTTVGGSSVGASFAVGGSSATLYASWTQLAKSGWSAPLPTSSFGLRQTAIDQSGNTVIASSYPAGTYGFGNGVASTMTSTSTLAVVKYSSTGTPMWIVNNQTATYTFTQLVVFSDSSGNTYAIGGSGAGPLDFGNGVVASFVYGGYFLIKISQTGSPTWVSICDFNGSGTSLSPLAVYADSVGSIYVVGSMTSGTYNFGNGVFTTYSGYVAGFVLKYNSSGLASWIATSDSSGSNVYDEFCCVTSDSSGNVFVGGADGLGATATNFGNGVSLAGPGGPVLVKYNSVGSAQWATNQTGVVNQYGNTAGYYNAVAVDSAGNIIVGLGQGYIAGPGFSGLFGGVLKFGPAGAPLWAVPVGFVASRGGLPLVGLVVDSANNIIAVSNNGGTATFGNNLSLNTTGGSSAVVKLTASGSPLWVQGLNPASTGDSVLSITLDDSNLLRIVGYISSGLCDFGNSVVLTGGPNLNLFSAQYINY